MSTGLITEMNGMIDRLQAENKRLRAINEELLEALREARGFCWGNGAPDSIIDPIDAAVAKATTPIISAESKG